MTQNPATASVPQSQAGAFPACHYRRPGPAVDRHRCLHPAVRAKDHLVDNLACLSCSLVTRDGQRTHNSSVEATGLRTNGDTTTIIPDKKRVAQAQAPARVLWILADLARGGIGTYTANLFKTVVGDTVEPTAVVFYTWSPHTTDFALARHLSRYTRVICTDERDIPEEVKQQHPYITFCPGPMIYDQLLDECDVVTTAARNPHIMRRTNWRGKPLLVQLHSVCDVTREIAVTLAPYASRYLVTSRESYDNATRKIGLPCDKVTLLELVVDANRLTTWQEPLELRRELLATHRHRIPDRLVESAHWALYFGRFSPEKRIPRIAEAVRELNGRGQPWVGLFVGDGWYAKPIKSQIRSILPRRSLLVPWTKHLGDILRAADAFLCASEYEGGPFSSMESLAAGIPVLSTDVGILPSLRLPLRPGGPPRRVYRSLGKNPTPQEIADRLQSTIGRRPITARQPVDWYLAEQIRGRFSLRRQAEIWNEVLASLLANHCETGR